MDNDPRKLDYQTRSSPGTRAAGAKVLPGRYCRRLYLPFSRILCFPGVVQPSLRGGFLVYRVSLPGDPVTRCTDLRDVGDMVCSRAASQIMDRVG